MKSKKILKFFHITIPLVVFIALLDLAAFMVLPYSLLFISCLEYDGGPAKTNIAVLFHDFDDYTLYGLDHETMRRMNHGISLFLKNHGKYLVVAGGNKPGRPEKGAELMKKYATENKIPAAKILVEDQSWDTLGNVKNIRTLLETKNEKDFVLVSSPYHLKRIALLGPAENLPTLSTYQPEGIAPELSRFELLVSAHKNLVAFLARKFVPDPYYGVAVKWIRENTDF